MKKFRFLLALAMVVTMISTVAFAADESLDGYGISVPATVEYTVGSPVTFDFTMIKGLEAEYGQIDFVYDTEVWTVNVETDMLITYDGENKIKMLYESGGTFTDGQVLATVTATLLDGATADGSTFEVTKVDFWGDDDYIYCEDGYKTITVKAAGPTKTEGDAVAAKTSFEADGKKYTNVALYEIKCDLVDGATEYGFTLADSAKGKSKEFSFGTNISGNGAIEYAFMFYNIEDASAVTAKPYYKK